MILAPLRGVTIRCFRETFATLLREGGFTEAITPFISALPGVDPLKNEELRMRSSFFTQNSQLPVAPQFIGKDPTALRACLERVRDVGFATADLNCGCPFPMVRRKGRGSGLLRTPDVLRRLLEVGCETMGPGRFSVKARLGIDRTDELLELMPMINAFPLRFLTVHARTARQMYTGACDLEAFARIASVSKVPLVLNGDISFPPPDSPIHTFTRSPLRPTLMVGRSFVRALGEREDSGELLNRYIEASCAELSGERPVLGRLKELIAYWKDIPRWRRLWPVIKLARTLDELRAVALTEIATASPVGV